VSIMTTAPDAQQIRNALLLLPAIADTQNQLEQQIKTCISEVTEKASAQYDNIHKTVKSMLVEIETRLVAIENVLKGMHVGACG